MHSPHEPIHHRDFMPMREQVPLRDAPTDAQGELRLACAICGRHSEVPLLELLARHGPDLGLVTLLNLSLPPPCRRASPDEPGRPRCDLHYPDLRGRR